ncbi:MAG: cobalamin B12-binding domain-containing protein [Burkholderiaceae bacterium]|nr:cobalamin B12-binding domain-containing protein [Burkholderiaceae bacterium]
MNRPGKKMPPESFLDQLCTGGNAIPAENIGDMQNTSASKSTNPLPPRTQMDWLVSTIEAEIIPRLMAAHQDEAVSTASGSAGIQQQDVLAFTNVVLHKESAACLEFIESILDRGVSLQTVYLELIAPAASRLGTMWHEDACDFTQVTIGLWRMQQVMYDLSPGFRTEHDGLTTHHHRIMLTTVPGSQHTLGILMVAEFFRRAGWGVWGEPAATRDQLIDAASREWFDVIGISVGSEPQLVDLKAFVDDLRQASQNRAIAIMVGGPVMMRHEEDLADYGADAIAKDADHAVQVAEQLVALRNKKSGPP